MKIMPLVVTHSMTPSSKLHLWCHQCQEHSTRTTNHIMNLQQMKRWFHTRVDITVSSMFPVNQTSGVSRYGPSLILLMAMFLPKPCTEVGRVRGLSLGWDMRGVMDMTMQYQWLRHHIYCDSLFMSVHLYWTIRHTSAATSNLVWYAIKYEKAWLSPAHTVSSVRKVS